MKNTTNDGFSVRQYGRTELVLEYSPHSAFGTLATNKNLTPKGAWQKLKL